MHYIFEPLVLLVPSWLFFSDFVLISPWRFPISEYLSPPGSAFTRFFVEKNGLNGSGFKKWVFEPPTLYGSTDMWWGPRGKRYRPHEGLDFCMFLDGRDRVVHFDGKTRIPAMYDGVVIQMVGDFLGRSIILEHDFEKGGRARFCTIYSHIRPHPRLALGRRIREGSIIATVEDGFHSKTDISPHLHISLGWIPRSIPNERLVWPKIGSPELMTMLDPLDFIVVDYRKSA